MPDVEATRDLIQRAKDWTGKIALDADTFSLMRQMWTALEEGVREPPIPEDEPARNICVHCGTTIQKASKHNGFVHGWRHLNGVLDFEPGLRGHDARPDDWTDPDQGPKSKKLSKIVKQAATRNHGGYPDESLMLLAEELKLNGL